jgi:hemin uptake protein HemP
MLLSHDVVAHSSATEPGHEPVPAACASTEIDSLRLLQGQRELRIRHGNEYYRLRHTRNDKLILTK